MSELSICFTRLPISLVNIILMYYTKYGQLRYFQVDEKTGKIYYLQNVRHHIKLVMRNYISPLNVFTDTRSTYWMTHSKLVTLFIEGETIHAIEHCLKQYAYRSRFTDDSYPELYISYERNQQPEYLHLRGECFGSDDTNPQRFYSCLLYRFDSARGQYFAHSVSVSHTGSWHDYTRQITIEPNPLDYLHECRALAAKYIQMRAIDRYAKKTLLTEMRYDTEIEENLEIGMLLLEQSYNPHLNIYEKTI